MFIIIKYINFSKDQINKVDYKFKLDDFLKNEYAKV